MSTSASTRYKEAEAAVRAAKAALQTARLNLGYTEVRAPVAGRVGRLEVTVGNLVAAGPELPVLTALVSVDPIYASFNANETIVARALAALSPEANAAADVGSITVEIATNAADAALVAGPPAAASTIRSIRRAARCVSGPCSPTRMVA